MATATCLICGRQLSRPTERMADAALSRHYWAECRAGYRERVAAAVHADRARIWRWLTATLPGWLIFADRVPPVESLTVPRWHAVQAPPDTPLQVAAGLPGRMSATDPDELVRLCRAHQTSRRAA